VEYATLSHCWGSIEILKLTKSNLQSLLEDIPECKLCKTFKDAIYIVRQFGLRYLWIDLLCIVQDDKEDWNRESVLMSAVYGQTTLNLAAAGAEDGSIGCFFDRDDRIAQQVRVRITAQGQQGLYACYDNNLYKTCFSSTPLANRAWALQERILPTRTLYFGETQIAWGCKHKYACDTFPDQIPGSFFPNMDDLQPPHLSIFWPYFGNIQKLS
jgi:hypothetical protein